MERSKWKWNYGRCNGRKKKRRMRESLWNGNGSRHLEGWKLPR